MKILIIGAGRMGIRHAQGALNVEEVEEVYLMDISEAAIDNAKAQLSSHPRFSRCKGGKIGQAKGSFDIVIIASTASDRSAICSLALDYSPGYLLIEKPLGQSYREVEDLVALFKNKPVNVSINLNTRLYGFINDLKKDLEEFPQFAGIKHINYNGGAIGIGANGIHYLDLLFHLLGADSATLMAGEIEPELIPSGRGPQFGDFGGWAAIRFFDAGKKYVGRSLLTLSATSTVFGGWEIIGSHARIRINELEGQRVDIIRDPASTLPVNRYAADYLPAHVRPIESPFLGDLTQKWITAAIRDKVNLLPPIDESLKVHRLLFDWLSLSSSYKDKFPIT